MARVEMSRITYISLQSLNAILADGSIKKKTGPYAILVSQETCAILA